MTIHSTCASMNEDPVKVTLELALQYQVLCEVSLYLSTYSDPEGMNSARIVMNFLTDSSVELSVDFTVQLVSLMVRFITELMQVRVRRITDMDARLSSDSLSHVELGECDKFLRNLRDLQRDMVRRDDINAGIPEEVDCISRALTEPIPPFAVVVGQSIEDVMERALLTNNVCYGHKLIVERGFSASYMRSRACLIAYNFFCSQQLESFFVGLHVLRHCGLHTRKVLLAIHDHSAVRFVRDRIKDHLRHVEGAIDDRELVSIEKLYSVNCYDTELHRRWSSQLDGLVGGSVDTGRKKKRGGQICKENGNIACGNIPDVWGTSGVKPTAAPGSSMSQEECSVVLRCGECQWDSDPFRVGEIHRPKSGYLHITPKWVSELTDTEKEMIFLDGVDYLPQKLNPTELRYLIDHKDWVGLRAITGGNEEVGVPSSSSGFVDRILKESVLQKLDARDEFLGNKICAIDDNASHISNIAWILNERYSTQLLLLYLRRFGLGRSKEEVDGILDQLDQIGVVVNSVTRSLLYGRLGNEWLTYAHPLTEGDPYAQLAMACFSGCDAGCQKQILKNFPILKQYLGEPMRDSSGGGGVSHTCLSLGMHDVNLGDLLGDVFPDLELAGICGQRVEVQEMFLESDIEYLLSQGRPAAAFVKYSRTGGDMSPVLMARRVAFYNLFSDGVVASCVAFLELCGEPTEMLRVDVQAARYIVRGESEESSSSYFSSGIIQVFLGFDQNGMLLKALKMLEEAAWAQEPPNRESDTSIPGTTASSSSPWHLVALFCRAHNLPRSLTLLHELARNGDWVMFLHEADLQQCPREAVLDVIALYFKTGPLQSHLNILLGRGIK